MSDYQSFKLVLVKFFSLDAKDVIHVYLGFLFFFIAILIFKKPITSYKLLIVGLIGAVIMEILDLRDDYTYFGQLRWAASLRDIVNTNFLPFLIIFLARLGLIKK